MPASNPAHSAGPLHWLRPRLLGAWWGLVFGLALGTGAGGMVAVSTYPAAFPICILFGLWEGIVPGAIAGTVLGWVSVRGTTLRRMLVGAILWFLAGGMAGGHYAWRSHASTEGLWVQSGSAMVLFSVLGAAWACPAGAIVAALCGALVNPRARRHVEAPNGGVWRQLRHREGGELLVVGIANAAAIGIPYASVTTTALSVLPRMDGFSVIAWATFGSWVGFWASLGLGPLFLLTNRTRMLRLSLVWGGVVGVCAALLGASFRSADNMVLDVTRDVCVTTIVGLLGGWLVWMRLDGVRDRLPVEE